MHTLRRATLLVFLSAIVGIIALFTVSRGAHAQEPAAAAAPQQQSQRLVEDVVVRGTRRLSTDSVLYFVQTRTGDTYNPEQVQRDLQAILAQLPLDKSVASVSLEDGTRGGVIVVFNVKELLIIRDIQFEGLKSVTEADVLKEFRENRVGISKESVFDPVKVRNAIRVIKELEAAKGHPNATVDKRTDDVSQTSTAVTFVIKEGERVRVVQIDFEGNENFSDGKLRDQMKFVKEAGLISRFKGMDILDRRKLEEDLKRVRFYMTSKGYLQARVGEPRIEGLGRRTTGLFIPLPLLSSTDEALRVTVPITEGKLYRIGQIKIEGNSIFSEDVIRNVIGLKPGDVADGQKLMAGRALFNMKPSRRRASAMIRKTRTKASRILRSRLPKASNSLCAVWSFWATRLRAITCCAVKSSSTKATFTIKAFMNFQCCALTSSAFLTRLIKTRTLTLRPTKKKRPLT